MRHPMRALSVAWACLLSLLILGANPANAQLNPCEEPNVLVVLDRSGSMLDGNPSKYNQAVTAINQLTAGFEDRIRFGLLVFPNSGDCGVTLPGAVLAPVNIDNGAAISAQLNGNARPNRNNNTPIGLSIQRAREYLLGLNDANRRRFIVLVTDGIERCNGNGATQARTALQNDVPTYVIGFGNGVDANALNNIAREGGTGQAYQANNAAQLSDVLAAIANAASAETCDGRDNDCDGQVDEAVPDVPCQTACGDGRQICQNGALSICFPTEPPPEVCDGADNDCDGVADEDVPAGGACATGLPGVCAQGVETCQGGGGQACLPLIPAGDEVCDGLDNDCDGQLDEGFGVGEACDTGLLGVCAQGAQACGVNEVICRPQVPSSPEACDGLDNDCDGAVDDDIADLGTDCATGQPGICAVGRALCLGGQVQCNSDAVPIAEACNGIDDDCDGRVDESVRNGCGRCAEDLTDDCDGLDADCDGALDEDANCPAGRVCAFGGCYEMCRNNECSGGLSCVDQVCVEACVADPCPPNQDCEAGLCMDPCADVDCGPGELCTRGRCVGPDTCAALGCPDAMVCTRDGCVADPCEGAQCAPDELCRGGACVGSCAFVACPQGEICTDGVCQSAPCGGVICPDGEVCGGTDCEADPCAGVACGEGEACIAGLCVVDPCAAARCPQGERCVLQAGVAQCERDDGFAPAEPQPGAGGEGGEGGAGGVGGVGGEGGAAGAGGDGPGGGEVGDGGDVSVRDGGVVVSADALEGGCACRTDDGGAPGPGLPALCLGLGLLLAWPPRRRR